VVNNNLEIKGTRGFHRPTGCLPRTFVHPTLAMKKDIAEKIRYKITKGAGGPAEDARMIWMLSMKYKGCWFEDALAIYQEERDINLQKAIDTNRAHRQTLEEMKLEGVIQNDHRYFRTIWSYHLKIFILHALRIHPRSYWRFIEWRDYGQLKAGWMLSAEKIDFIRKQQKDSVSSMQRRKR